MKQIDLTDDWEGFRLFTRRSIEELRERRLRIKANEVDEKRSGAKHSILKGK